MLSLGLALAAGPSLARCADWTPQAKPQNASRDIVGQDLDTIQERGWIEFAVYEAFPPYSFGTREAPEGIDIEIGRIIAADLGVEPRFKFVDAGENLDADLRIARALNSRLPDDVQVWTWAGGPESAVWAELPPALSRASLPPAVWVSDAGMGGPGEGPGEVATVSVFPSEPAIGESRTGQV